MLEAKTEFPQLKHRDISHPNFQKKKRRKESFSITKRVRNFQVKKCSPNWKYHVHVFV